MPNEKNRAPLKTEKQQRAEVALNHAIMEAVTAAAAQGVEPLDMIKELLDAAAAAAIVLRFAGPEPFDKRSAFARAASDRFEHQLREHETTIASEARFAAERETARLAKASRVADDQAILKAGRP